MKNSNLYKLGHIRTFSGQFVNLTDPDPSTINIIDIAHSLGNLCRFAGHTINFYSVAEHSIQCANLLDDQNKLAGLLHDASEAYLMDIPRPLKALLPGYKALEDKFMQVIANKFGFEYPLSQEVVGIDNFMLEYEWSNYVLSSKGILRASHMNPDLAAAEFLKAYHMLKETAYIPNTSVNAQTQTIHKFQSVNN